MLKRGHAVIAVLVLASACIRSSSSSTAPGPQPQNFTGTWSGNLVLQGTSTRMTWTLTQNNSAVTGPALVALPNGIVLLNGTLSGTVSGSTLTYSIGVSPGGIPSQPSCAGQLGGAATANAPAGATTLAGSYSLISATCTTAFSSGTFTLTKQ